MEITDQITGLMTLHMNFVEVIYLCVIEKQSADRNYLRLQILEEIFITENPVLYLLLQVLLGYLPHIKKGALKILVYYQIYNRARTMCIVITKTSKNKNKLES